jgi:LEA14-like dessication related protein
MKLPPSRAFALLLLILGLTGCMSGSKPGGVIVTALTLQLGLTSPTEVRAPLLLRFANENVIPLGYSSSSHKLYLNGTYVGKAVNDQPIGLPPMNQATREVYIQFENPAFVRQLAAGGGSHQVAYRMETVLFQTAGEDKLEIKTRSEGTLELRNAAN